MSKPSQTHQHCPDCGHNGCLDIYEDGGTHCYSCLRTKKGKKLTQKSMKLVLDPEPSESKFEVPSSDSLTDEFPFEARKWLLTYGIDSHVRKKYGIKYVPNVVMGKLKIKGAIYLPVIHDTIIGYQLRFLEGNRKYLTVGNPHPAIFGDGTSTDTLVIVEDILSAIRIAETGLPVRARALLGVSGGGYERLMKLLTSCSEYAKVIIWLDDDDAGQLGSSLLSRRIGMYTNVSIVHSNLEPKECYNEEIRERLRQASPISS